MRTRTDAGKMYGRRVSDGRLEEVDWTQHVPDTVICRRAADYPHGAIPHTACFTNCTRCEAPIVYNPAGPHQDKPKVCMQCAQIQPLPIEGQA